MKNPFEKFFASSGKTKCAVSQESGISQNFFIALTNGKNPDITISTLRPLHKATGIPYEDLIEFFFSRIEEKD